MKRSGDRFEIFKVGKLWYWHLQGANYPTGPIAKSGQGYTSRTAVVNAIRSAQSAARGANGVPVEREAPPNFRANYEEGE